MKEIHHKQFPAYLKTTAKDKDRQGFAPVFLIYGEEYLCKTALESLLDALIPGPSRNLNFEPVDSTDDGVVDAVKRVNTYAFVPGRKVVAIQDAQVFHSGKDTEKILAVVKKSCEADNMKKAAVHFLKLLALMNLSLEDIGESDIKALLKTGTQKSDSRWLEAVIVYCRERKLPMPKSEDSRQVLVEAVEKGFPEGNHLIITTDIVDKRRVLFKALLKEGIVVDCSVPKGARKADKVAQESVLKEKMASILKEAGKTAGQGVYQAMANMTGFDLRTFINNLQKLVSYSGDRKEITRSDVAAVLRRTKRDPIYEFTNAVTDRNIEPALFYMDSLLSDSDTGHPLQLLSAIINQIRKLLVIKGFVENDQEKSWYAACPFNFFQSRVMPAVQTHDRELLNHLKQWQNAISGAGVSAHGKKEKGGGKKKKSRATTDLVIAKNPKNVYPVYQMFRKSEQFTREELISTIEALSLADQRMKTTGQDPRRILEHVIFSICFE